jgi:hypothetical protein
MNSLRSILKVSQLTGLCAALTLAASFSSANAQNDNPRPADRGPGGQGGPGGPGGGPGGRGGFDPAQMQQRMMEGVRKELGFTDDNEWKVVEPMVQKVFDTRVSGMGGGFGRLMGGGRNRGGDQGGGRRGGPFGGNQSPEAEALQKAIDDNAPAAQIKDFLVKYKAAQKAKLEKSEQAQAELRKVLSVKQEAAATLLGLLN